MVVTLGVSETVTCGIVDYGFPVFLQAMERDLGASRVAVTGAFLTGLGVAALSALPVGRWIDRHGTRALMTTGSCLATALTVAWSRVESVPALYAVWTLMGLAMAATLYEPAFAAVVSWFVRRRDRALLSLTLMAGLASTIFMPIEAWLMARMGWRAALLTLAVVLRVITIPLHVLVLRRGPGSGPVTAGAPRPPDPSSFTLGEAARTAVFWVLGLAFLVSNFATAAMTIHLMPYLTGHGYSAAVAAATIGWMGAMPLPGRVLLVPVARTLGPRWVTAGVFLGQAAGIVQVLLLGFLRTVVGVVVLLGASNGMFTRARDVPGGVFRRAPLGPRAPRCCWSRSAATCGSSGRWRPRSWWSASRCWRRRRGSGERTDDPRGPAWGPGPPRPGPRGPTLDVFAGTHEPRPDRISGASCGSRPAPAGRGCGTAPGSPTWGSARCLPSPWPSSL